MGRLFKSHKKLDQWPFTTKENCSPIEEKMLKERSWMWVNVLAFTRTQWNGSVHSYQTDPKESG